MPPLLRLPARFLSDRLKGFGSWCGAAFWWLLEWAGDKLLGDTAFGWLRDMVSPFAQYAWIALLWTYGIPFGLVALGAYFFLRSGTRAPSEAPIAVPPQIAPATTAPAAFTAAQTPPTATTSHRPTHQGSAVSVTPAAKAPPPRDVELMSKSLPGWEILYQVAQSGTISLRFLPDTKKPLGEALCLILLAHKLLYGRERVSVGVIEDGVRQSMRNKPKSPLEAAFGLQAIAIELVQNLGEEAVDSGKVERVDLAKGGAYTFTWWGEAETLATAKDMIRRA